MASLPAKSRSVHPWALKETSQRRRSASFGARNCSMPIAPDASAIRACTVKLRCSAVYRLTRIALFIAERLMQNVGPFGVVKRKLPPMSVVATTNVHVPITWSFSSSSQRLSPYFVGEVRRPDLIF